MVRPKVFAAALPASSLGTNQVAPELAKKLPRYPQLRRDAGGRLVVDPQLRSQGLTTSCRETSRSAAMAGQRRGRMVAANNTQASG